MGFQRFIKVGCFQGRLRVISISSNFCRLHSSVYNSLGTNRFSSKESYLECSFFSYPTIFTTFVLFSLFCFGWSVLMTWVILIGSLYFLFIVERNYSFLTPLSSGNLTGIVLYKFPQDVAFLFPVIDGSTFVYFTIFSEKI